MCSHDAAQGCLIGLDLGTSSVKGVLMTVDGRILCTERLQNAYEAPGAGRVEFDAELLYARVAGILRKLAAALPGRSAILAVSMASASGNTLLVGDDGEPLLPAISWMDTRVTDEIGKVFGALDKDEVHRIIGWPLTGMFPPAHLSWLKCREPASLEKSAHICMTTDYINFRLTGEWGIDPSTATTFYLQDQVSGKWHAPLLQPLGIPERKLPPIRASGSVLGRITRIACDETGIPGGTPVVLGAFDHPCAARGAGVLDEGQLLISCGTSWVEFRPSRDRPGLVARSMLVDPFLRPSGPWGGMISLPAIAERIDRYLTWFISDAPDRYERFDSLSAASKPGAGGLRIDIAQEPDSAVPGRYAKPEIARAVMEGVALRLKSVMRNSEENGPGASYAAMVGGPSAMRTWPQVVCDVLGVPLRLIHGVNAGAVGAAVLAGIGAGCYRDEEDAFEKSISRARIIEPDGGATKLYDDILRSKSNTRFPCPPAGESGRSS